MNKKLKKQSIKKIAKELFFISLGCAIYSFALLHFNVPNQLAEGGPIPTICFWASCIYGDIIS